MWYKKYNEVNGIITKSNTKYSPRFEIDFDKLSRLANNSKFIEKVQKIYEENKDSFRNIVVYQTNELQKFGEQKGEVVNMLYVVFDHSDIFISLIACNTNSSDSYIFEFSQNKTFVSIMSELL